MSPHKIISVENPGPCAGLGIDPGDALLAVNGRPVADVFDYRMFISENPVTLTVQKKDGQCVELRAEKPENADLGLVFGSGLMDASRSCANRCVFCFIDQLPPGMRPTLYHKDDDMRLSFLSGNYVTLTNMPRSEIDRLIAHRLSPVNISVHATDPSVRVSMLKNPKAALIMENICKFSDAGIAMNFQIVLCKGINDGEVLERSVRDLAGLMRDAEPGGSRSER
ncbi:MAG: PDZ domain-containing protein, partial [Firmicutes bacterium]|nr:PDZ domain-containing protein [Bacillota bacterium]